MPHSRKASNSFFTNHGTTQRRARPHGCLPLSMGAHFRPGSRFASKFPGVRFVRFSDLDDCPLFEPLIAALRHEAVIRPYRRPICSQASNTVACSGRPSFVMACATKVGRPAGITVSGRATPRKMCFEVAESIGNQHGSSKVPA